MCICWLLGAAWLTAIVGKLQDKGYRVTVLKLRDLLAEDTNQLLVDTLKLPAVDCRALNQGLVECSNNGVMR